jgi:hypothetical protein
MGIQNAYARLTDEIATLIGEDATIREGMLRLNEAYGVLSNPESRRRYDDVYFSREIAQAERAEASAARRRRVASRFLVGALLSLVLLQVAALTYLGRDTASDVASAVLGPLFPDSAGAE